MKCAFSVLTKKAWPNAVKIIFPIFLLRNVLVLYFTFRSVIHFVDMMQLIEVFFFCFFKYVYPVVLAPFIEKIILLPLNCICTLAKNQLSKYA